MPQRVQARLDPWHITPCLLHAMGRVQFQPAARPRPPPHSRNVKRREGKRQQRGGVLRASWISLEYILFSYEPVVCLRSRLGSRPDPCWLRERVIAARSSSLFTSRHGTKCREGGGVSFGSVGTPKG